MLLLLLCRPAAALPLLLLSCLLSADLVSVLCYSRSCSLSLRSPPVMTCMRVAGHVRTIHHQCRPSHQIRQTRLHHLIKGIVVVQALCLSAHVLVAVLLGVGAAVFRGWRRGGGGGGAASREPTAGGAAPTPKVTGDAGSTSGKSGKTKSGSSKTKSSSKSGGSGKPRKKERRKYNGLVESEEEEEEEDVEANGGVELQPATEKREMEVNDMDL